MNVDKILIWQAFITQAAALGVKSFGVIKALLQDAGADDATIAALTPKWNVLYDDVQRAAEGR
jgi:hypothetical protein